MKSLSILCFAIVLISTSCKKNTDSTTPPEENNPFVPFSHLYGGSSYDAIVGCVPAIDGGYVFSGITESADGDIATHFGGPDLWLSKMDASGKIIWSHNYGGSQDEFSASALVAVSDGYIVAGATTSTDGNVTIVKDEFRNHWIFKVDKSGEIKWQKKFSSYEGAQILAMKKAKNGDLIGAGYVFPRGGQDDAWLFRLTSEGNLIWEKTYDALTKVAASISESANGDIYAGGNITEIANSSQDDALVLKTDAQGNLKWLKAIGSSAFDYNGNVAATSDGGVLMAATTVGNDGFATGSRGNNEMIVAKLDANGEVEWNKTVGGSDNDENTRFISESSDGNYIIAATSSSGDGDMPGTHVNVDAWLLMFNSSGSIIDKKRFGGNNVDVIYDLLTLGDNRYLAAGTSTSTGTNFSDAHGGYDGWIMTIGE